LKFIKQRQHFWYGGWTHVNTLGKAVHIQEKEAWDKVLPENKHEIFENWALENRKIACDSIYNNPFTHEKVTENFEITTPLEFAWFEETKKRILRAGIRTAIVLNSLLEQREASRLRQGSGVLLLDDTNAPLRPTFPPWVKNITYNLVICLVILGVFIYVTKFYSGPPATTIHTRKSSPAPGSPAVQLKEMRESKLR